VLAHVAADVACRGDDIREVGGPILVRGRSHGNELHRAVSNAVLDARGETQAARRAVAAHDLLEPGLVDGDAPGFEDVDLAPVQIEAEDVVADVGEAGARDQAHVAGTDDGDLHVPMDSRTM